MNFLKKKSFGISLQKNLVLRNAYAQSPLKCSNFEILAKIEGKEAKKIFSKIYQGHIRIWLRSTKFETISCLCNFKEWNMLIVLKLRVFSKYYGFGGRLQLPMICRFKYLQSSVFNRRVLSPRDAGQRIELGPACLSASWNIADCTSLQPEKLGPNSENIETNNNFLLRFTRKSKAFTRLNKEWDALSKFVWCLKAKVIYLAG